MIKVFWYAKNLYIFQEKGCKCSRVVKQFIGKKVSFAKYGGRYTVSMIPGDGIGPEMMSYVKNIFRSTGVPVDFEKVELDVENNQYESLQNAVISVKRNGIALKGNLKNIIDKKVLFSSNVELRTQLDLFANVIHCKSIPGVSTRHKDVDIIIVRQNTEGEYSMLEHESTKGVIESLKIITRECSERIAHFAFDYAKAHKRKKVTTVHKANIMKLSDGLFLETCQKIAKDYPGIEHNDMIIDNCCMQLISNPQQFDVLLTPNLYGTVVNNVVSGLVGGPGIISGQNYGTHYALFEPGTRNTGSNLVGKNIANPFAMFWAARDMLIYLGLHRYALLLHNCIMQSICEDGIKTSDIGGVSSTSEVVTHLQDLLMQKMENMTWMTLTESVTETEISF